MSCETVLELLIDYHYGELAAEQRVAVAAHLGSCASCALEYCRLHSALSGIGSLLDESVRPEVHAALRAKVTKTFRPPWWRALIQFFTAPVPLYQAAAVVALLLAGWILIQAGPFRSDRTLHRPSTVKSAAVGEYDASQVLRIDPNVL